VNYTTIYQLKDITNFSNTDFIPIYDIESGETNRILVSDFIKIIQAVEKINGKTGTTINLNPDDLNDSQSLNKFVSDAEKGKIQILKNDRGSSYVLCGDGIYRDISSMASGGGSIVCNTITERNSLTGLKDGQLVLVRDASEDSTVTSGSALYDYNSGTGLFNKVSEYESLDLVLSFENLEGEVSGSTKLVSYIQTKVQESDFTTGDADVNGFWGNVTLTVNQAFQRLKNKFSEYYTKLEIDSLFTSYYTKSQIDTALSGKSTTGHTHSLTEVDGLVDALTGKETTIASGTTSQYWRGDKVWSDFMSDVRVTSLSGYTVGSNITLATTDTVLVAFGKIQAQLNAKESTLSKGSFIQGDNITLSGDLQNRLVGTGDIVISAYGDEYTHPTGFSSPVAVTGSTIISQVLINDEGHVTGVTTRDLTASDISAATESDLAAYVLKSGDTMTGDLLLAGASVTTDTGTNNSSNLILRGFYDSDGSSGVTSTKRDFSFRNKVSTNGLYQLDILNDSGSVISTFTDDGIWVNKLSNLNNAGNSSVAFATSGTFINTSVAGNTSLRVENTNASPTGDLTQWVAGSTVKAHVDILGGGHFTNLKSGGQDVVKTNDTRLSDKRIPVDSSVAQAQMNPSFIMGIYDIPASEKVKLETAGNWDLEGHYIGEPVVNTAQGQEFYSVDYFYKAIDDNSWIRMVRQ
jgi:hypothetical protein